MDFSLKTCTKTSFGIKSALFSPDSIAAQIAYPLGYVDLCRNQTDKKIIEFSAQSRF
jgi:hypothetical protein